MKITLKPDPSTEEITTAILRVLDAIGKATALKITNEVEHDPGDKQRIRSTVYSLSTKQFPVIKYVGGTNPKQFEITKIGKDYLNGNKQWQGAAAEAPISPDDKNELPYIPGYVYNVAKDYNLNTGEMMFYLWGRSQMKSNAFKFTDQGAATMLCCNVTTIRNWKRDLKRKGLLTCSTQNREGGRFGASCWIFHRRPPEPAPPQIEDNDPYPF